MDYVIEMKSLNKKAKEIMNANRMLYEENEKLKKLLKENNIKY
jgi:regulator of replication initiation timing|tara:strand:- start:656 stop:784 length:129 start_codon:yes stop_codon:yes gene_type:complete